MSNYIYYDYMTSSVCKVKADGIEFQSTMSIKWIQFKRKASQLPAFHSAKEIFAHSHIQRGNLFSQ